MGLNQGNDLGEIEGRILEEERRVAPQGLALLCMW
jgi:hypothetical protein